MPADSIGGIAFGSVGNEQSMRNRLQYAYSIAVFFGALSTAYFMMNREGNVRLPIGSYQSPELKAEASLVDPAVSSLFEMESELKKSTKVKPETLKRLPTQTKPLR